MQQKKLLHRLHNKNKKFQTTAHYEEILGHSFKWKTLLSKSGNFRSKTLKVYAKMPQGKIILRPIR